MDKSSLAAKIQAEIKEKKICPKAKIWFTSKNLLFWSLGVASLLIGSLGVAVMLDIIISADWSVRDTLLGREQAWLVGIPYAWIIVTILFLLLAEKEIRATKRGYRYAGLTIGLVLLSGTAAAGAGLYYSGVGAATDTLLAHNIASYKYVGNRQHLLWIAPDEGRLAGIIVLVQDENHIVLLDAEGMLWDVDITDAENPKAVPVAQRRHIKVKGEQIAPHQFLARVVLPFHKDREIPEVLRFRAELQEADLDDFIRQSRERNVSLPRITQ